MNKANEMILKIAKEGGLSQASSSKIEELSNILSNLHIETENNEKVKKYATRILEKENEKTNRYETFLESSSMNGLIYGPTQLGKSGATREFIEACFKANVPVIVSTDNKTDQCEQLYSRIRNDLGGSDIKMMKVLDKSFGDEFKKSIINGSNRIVIFCLDNAPQVEKLIVNITSLATRHPQEMKKFNKFALIHDEADVISKDNRTNEIHEEQAESHKKWIELVNLINKNISYIDLKRIFITATPENCMMLYKIDSVDIMKLKMSNNYIGYKDIDYIEFEDDLDVMKILKKEVTRIKGQDTCEVILYCIERKIADGHDAVLLSLSKNLRCIINTYNGNGITAYMRTVVISNKFESMLKKEKIKYSRNEKMFNIKMLTIRKFYSMCKELGENCVVTIGKDLISRGISYVSEDTHEPLTATTMIYKPGTTMHAVAICQTIGRITGCAMPNLTRRLYAPKDVIHTYVTYNKNQELYINKMEIENKLTKDIISETEFDKYERDIDRKKLKLKMNMKETIRRNTQQAQDINKMQRLINMWWNSNSIIGKILRFVYESEIGVSENELKEMIRNNRSTNIDGIYKHMVSSGKEYKLVFQRDNNHITKLRKEAIEYIKNKY